MLIVLDVVLFCGFIEVLDKKFNYRKIKMYVYGVIFFDFFIKYVF